MHGYLSFVAVALGAFTVVGLVCATAFYQAPWRFPPPTEDMPFLRTRRIRSSVKPRADATITIGSTVQGSGDPTDTFEFSVGANKKLVLELLGPTSVQAGIWNVDSNGDNIVPGLLRVCGTTSRGCHLWGAKANCSIEVQNATGGAYSLMLREWSFLDYFTINSYKNTC